MLNGQGSKLQKLSRLQRTCALICVCYLLCAAAFYFVAAKDWDVRASETTLMAPGKALEGLAGDVVVEQPFLPNQQMIDQVSVYLGLFGDVADKTITVAIEQGGSVLAEKTLPLTGLTSIAYNDILFDAPASVNQAETATIRISMPDLAPENGVVLYYDDQMGTIRGSISVGDDVAFLKSGESIKGSLSLKVLEHSIFEASQTYLYLAIAGFVLLAGAMLWQMRKFRRHQDGLVIRLMMVLGRYRYLVGQMVSRDFNVKYKRSILGVLWSFLNPILTMAVQFFIFSTLFKSDIEHFQVYLLTGIITFNYFMEASGVGLNAIVGNASLITKVYVPKFIYPIVPVFSATINLLLSLIPLLVVVLLNGLVFTKALLLLPIGILFVMIFSMGMSMILSTCMVFFRDTKFLWGVVSLLWNFLTPIFYPESIIPDAFIGLYHMNPMYQFIYFMRTVIIGGVSPNPITYLYCIAAAVIPFMLGLFLFRKYQDKFVFNL